VARLVTSANDVVEVIDTLSETQDPAPLSSPRNATELGDPLREALDALDDSARAVFDGFPARQVVGVDDLVAHSGLPPVEVIRSLPTLEAARLVERHDGGYRIRRTERSGGTCGPGRAEH
jgi:predicted Rossmann fold nucleotide-binding protein DprA/Smf involved in DNA uptake